MRTHYAPVNTRYLIPLAALLGACGGLGGPHDAPPEHCALPTVASQGPGEVAAQAWWRPGPLEVGTTLPWPTCPPLRESTASAEDEPRVTFPADDGVVAPGLWPVVIFGHANSVSVCNPTDRYRSLHEQWASWGWVVYSVDASAQNCTDWSAQNMRIRVGRHAEALEDRRARNADPDSPFFGRLDLDTVVAAGHSRGGATAVTVLSETDDYVGAISLQGGNPAKFQLGDTFTTRPVVGISGELDKDLDFPHVDLTEELMRGRYSWHTLRRGNHSFTADGLPIRGEDDPDEILPRVAQIELIKHLTTAFLAANFGVWNGETIAVQAAAADALYSHEGDLFARQNLAGDGYWSRWSRGADEEAIWIDRFDARAVGLPPEEVTTSTSDPTVNDLGRANHCDGLARCEEVWTYAADAEEPPGAGTRLASARLLVARDAPGVFQTVVDQEVRAGWRLQARVRAEIGTDTAFDVLLSHDENTTRIPHPDALRGVELGDRYVQLDVPVSAEEIDHVAFEVHRGAIYLDDLRFVAP